MTAARPEPLQAPDFAEPLVAWRVWRVVSTGDGYRLGSVVKTALWTPGEALTAECLREPSLASIFRRHPTTHEAPAEHCDCGIYAGDLSTVAVYLAPSASEAGLHVLGRVMLWGTVVECERGFRASFAYPACLFVPAYNSTTHGFRHERLAAALQAYGVPVTALDAPASEAARRLEQLESAAARRRAGGPGRSGGRV